jgi:hypothetical protein
VGTLKKALAVSLLLCACGEPAERPDAAPQTRSQDVAAGCQQFAREGLKLKARTRAGLEAEAGRPSKISAQVEPNRHTPNVQDSILRFEYEGLTVQMRKPGPGGEMFESVIVSKRKWLNFPFFQPGVSEANLIHAIGEPQRRDGNRLIYTCGSGEADEPVVFEMNEGAVQRIVFNYYVD